MNRCVTCLAIACACALSEPALEAAHHPKPAQEVLGRQGSYVVDLNDLFVGSMADLLGRPDEGPEGELGLAHTTDACQVVQSGTNWDGGQIWDGGGRWDNAKDGGVRFVDLSDLLVADVCSGIPAPVYRLNPISHG